MSIAKETIEEVRDRASLAELTSDLPKFRRSGNGYTACCPFHKDEKPSFSINDEDGVYYCFGCGAKGSVFDYVMNTKNLSFLEAVNFLAAKFGVLVKEEHTSDRERAVSEQRSNERRFLRKLCSAVSVMFQEELGASSGQHAREYLESRGVSQKAIEVFGLGYAPSGWDTVLPKMLSGFAGSGVSEQMMKKHLLSLGFIKQKATSRDRPSQTGVAATDDSMKRNYYDVFRDRVIFPITRSDGQPVAFGGRDLCGSSNVPKYINCSESPVYRKREMFFGLSQALVAMRRSREAFLVEGYLDVVSMHQSGFHATLAVCGTAVTCEHVNVLKRIVNRLNIVFDGDKAGRAAAARCFEQFLNSGIDVRVVMLPAGHDPDSLARSHTRSQLLDVFKTNERSGFDVFVDELFVTNNAASSDDSAVAIGRAAKQIAGMLQKVVNSVEREFLGRQAAERLGVSYSSLLELLEPSDKSIPQPKPGISLNKHLNRRDKQFNRNSEYRKIQNRNGERSVSVSRPPAVRQVGDTDWKPLIVALLCEPQLAENVLSMPLVLGEMVDGEVAEQLPDNVKAFILDLSQSDLSGVSSSRLDHDLSESVDKLRSLLYSHNLPADEMVQEAVRQIGIGGGDPDAIVADVGRMTSRKLLKNQVQALRIKEAGEQSDAQLIEIAQEKLKARREMERLNLGQHYSKE